MGIVLDARHVLSCAHVVNCALGFPVDEQALPSRKVAVTFPMASNAVTIDGAVSLWRPMDTNRIGDIAVLELDQDIPTEVGFAKFSDVRTLRKNEELQVFGVRAGEAKGNHVSAQYAGPIDTTVVQFDGSNFAKPFIMPGFSGYFDLLT